jgi:thiol-disulfide isomerase/thioredoxin
MQDVESVEQFEREIGDSRPTVAVFKTDWCPDCKFIEPFMPEVVEQYHDMNFIAVNRDRFPELFERLSVIGIPSFIVFRRGQELVRFVSKLRKTREEVEQFLDRARAVAAALPANARQAQPEA